MQSKSQLSYLKYQVASVVSFILLVFSPSTATASIIFSVDYEDGTFGSVNTSTGGGGTKPGSLANPPHSLYPKSPGTDGISAVIATDQVRSGTKAVKFTLVPTDAGWEYSTYKDPYVRAELEKSGLTFSGQTRWYGASIRVDSRWEDNVSAGSGIDGALVMQWHTGNSGCGLSSPPFAILFDDVSEPDGPRWRISSISSPLACATTAAGDFTRRTWTFPGTKGEWVDWVVQIKWSTGSDGFLRVWKDGVQVINQSGATYYNSETTMRIKWGVYKPRWATETIPPGDIFVVHHDEIKIGDENSSYTEVAPKNSSSTVVIKPVAPTNLQTTIK